MQFVTTSFLLAHCRMGGRCCYCSGSQGPLSPSQSPATHGKISRPSINSVYSPLIGRDGCQEHCRVLTIAGALLGSHLLDPYGATDLTLLTHHLSARTISRINQKLTTKLGSLWLLELRRVVAQRGAACARLTSGQRPRESLTARSLACCLCPTSIPSPLMRSPEG